MENRIFTMVVVAALAIVLGIGIVSRQAKNVIDKPLLQEILNNQEALKMGQITLQKKLAFSSAQPFGGADTVKIQRLEGRIAALETQLKGMQEIFKKLQVPGARQQPPGPPPEDFSKIYDIPVDHSYVKGNKDAKVTIVEFVDIECPFCARFHVPVNEALKAYPNDVKVIVKNFPLSFHKNARPAAKAALAAGLQGKYFEMIDKLLENQRQLNEEKFKEIAGELGLKVDKFFQDYKNNDAEWEDIIQKDFQLGQKVGVRGTPTFFINGKKTTARDLASYKREIDKILSE